MRVRPKTCNKKWICSELLFILGILNRFFKWGTENILENNADPRILIRHIFG